MKIEIKKTDKGIIKLKRTVGDVKSTYDFVGESYKKELSGQKSLLGVGNSGVLPPGLRVIKQNPSILVFEKPPHVATVKYYLTKKSHRSKQQVTQLPVPWSVYIVTYNDAGQISNMRYFWRNSQLKGYNSSLWQPLVTNMHEGGQVCLSSYVKGAPGVPTLASVMDLGLRAVWGAGYNYDIQVSPYSRSGILRAEKKWKDKYPHKFSGAVFTPAGSWGDIRTAFPTHGMSLFDVVNQQYAAPMSPVIQRPAENQKDMDGEFTLLPFVTLGDILKYYKNSESKTSARTWVNLMNRALTSDIRI